jgi:hypothetical protein
MKLSLDALKQRAEVTASTELLATISGGTENACHVPCIHETMQYNPKNYQDGETGAWLGAIVGHWLFCD